MKISLGIPSKSTIESYLAYSRKALFNYKERLQTKSDESVKGYDNDHHFEQVGKGEQDWENAKEVLLSWKHFPSKWTKIYDFNESVEVGNEVAVTFLLFGIWWINSARVVYKIDEPNRFGFAYGTLEGHVESGEEIFLLERDADGHVFYHIKAFSKPAYWFVRLGYPLARRYQKKFVRESMAEVRNMVKSSQKVMA